MRVSEKLAYGFEFCIRLFDSSRSKLLGVKQLHCARVEEFFFGCKSLEFCTLVDCVSCVNCRVATRGGRAILGELALFVVRYRMHFSQPRLPALTVDTCLCVHYRMIASIAAWEKKSTTIFGHAGLLETRRELFNLARGTDRLTRSV